MMRGFRVKIEQVEILTHEGLKEGIQCGDLRARKERDLSLQVADEREVLGGICCLELTGERGEIGTSSRWLRHFVKVSTRSSWMPV